VSALFAILISLATIIWYVMTCLQEL